ncbi:MAG: hypothetical protein Q9157_001854 [Trypethelium eluteriae]
MEARKAEATSLGKAIEASLIKPRLQLCIVVSAIQQHFRSTLQQYDQPDTFDIAAVYLRPATTGKVIVDLEDVKLGASISTVHFTLRQNGKNIVVGYASNTNLKLATGISHLSSTTLDPRPAPANFIRLKNNGMDANWVGFTIPYHPMSFLKPVTHFQFFSPINAPAQNNITDVWIRFASAQEKFTTVMLGSIADHWHRMPENYLPQSKWNNVQLPKIALQAANTGSVIQGYSTSYRYPTLSLHLEIKKKLPPEGTQFLFIRAQSNEIKNGRFDANITILDENLELVALSHQVCLVTKGAQIPDVGMEPRKRGKL